MRLGRCLALSLLMAGPASAQDAEFDPSTLDLPALVECRADVQAYNAFAFWLAAETDTSGKLGWQETESGNPFLKQYRLPAPVSVFGQETDTIVFTASGPMAVLDGISAPDMARKLEITPEISTAEKFLGEKVVVDKTEEDAGMRFQTRISVNVSTVDSHPGKTLAGCSYSIGIQEAG
jgi:hypothetical protein